MSYSHGGVAFGLAFVLIAAGAMPARSAGFLVTTGYGDAFDRGSLIFHSSVSLTGAALNTSDMFYGLAAGARAESALQGGGVVLRTESSLSGTYSGDALVAPASFGEAAFADTIVVSSPGQTGAGFLDIQLKYDGFITGGASNGFVQGNAFGGLCDSWFCSKGGAQVTPLASIFGKSVSLSPDGVADLGVIEFTYGVPFDLSFYVVENAFLIGAANGAITNIDTDFSRTATLRPLRVFKADGSSDFGASILSTTDPAVVFGVAVPEPATWTLMLGGLGLVGSALRRRRMAVPSLPRPLPALS